MIVPQEVAAAIHDQTDLGAAKKTMLKMAARIEQLQTEVAELRKREVLVDAQTAPWSTDYTELERELLFLVCQLGVAIGLPEDMSRAETVRVRLANLEKDAPELMAKLRSACMGNGAPE